MRYEVMPTLNGLSIIVDIPTTGSEPPLDLVDEYLLLAKDEIERLRAFHDFFRGHCEDLFFAFGIEAIDVYNKAALRGEGGR